MILTHNTSVLTTRNCVWNWAEGGTKLCFTRKKQRKNRLDFSSLHQSYQSYGLSYDLQNGRDWPTGPLQLLMRTNIVLSVLRVQQAGCCTSLRPFLPAGAAVGKPMRVSWHTHSILYCLMRVSEPGMHHGGWICRAWGASACIYPDSRPPPRRPTTTATTC